MAGILTRAPVELKGRSCKTDQNNEESALCLFFK